MSDLGEIVGFLAKGGPVLMILAVISVFTVALVLIKLFQFYRSGLFGADRTTDALINWRASGGTAVPAWLPARPHPADRVLAAAMHELLGGTGRSEPQIREEVTRLALAQIAALSRYLRGLEVVAQVAPLLGLFGTILGMISAFQVLEQSGSRADPALLAGGIWEALLTTAAGLAVAIPAAAFHHWLESVVDDVTRQIEDAATRLFTAPVRLPHGEDARAA